MPTYSSKIFSFSACLVRRLYFLHGTRFPGLALSKFAGLADRLLETFEVKVKLLYWLKEAPLKPFSSSGCMHSAYQANAWVQINNGTYKSGFATTQAAYDRAQQELYSGLDAIEQRLSKSRFLLGDRCLLIFQCDKILEILAQPGILSSRGVLSNSNEGSCSSSISIADISAVIRIAAQAILRGSGPILILATYLAA